MIVLILIKLETELIKVNFLIDDEIIMQGSKNTRFFSIIIFSSNLIHINPNMHETKCGSEIISVYHYSR